MNIEPLFMTPVGVNFLEGIDNDALIEFCHKNLDSRNQSSGLDNNKQPLKHLADEVTKNVNNMHKSLGLKYSQEISYSWCNYGNAFDICRPHVHSHSNSFFVAVYYLTDSDVKLNFLNPVSQIEKLVKPSLVDEYNCFSQFVQSVSPKKGMLIVHPSWIVHYIDNVKDNRMSIAFDFEVKEDQH